MQDWGSQVLLYYCNSILLILFLESSTRFYGLKTILSLECNHKARKKEVVWEIGGYVHRLREDTIGIIFLFMHSLGWPVNVQVLWKRKRRSKQCKDCGRLHNFPGVGQCGLHWVPALVEKVGRAALLCSEVQLPQMGFVSVSSRKGIAFWRVWTYEVCPLPKFVFGLQVITQVFWYTQSPCPLLSVGKC